MPVGAAVVGMDANDDNLDYSLGGANAALFEIGSVDDPDTDSNDVGQITVGMGTELDYETVTMYTVTVTATDSFAGKRHHHGQHHGHRQE